MAFGRLGCTPGAQPMHAINMTPLIDVMLVLLVIFILAAPFMAGALKVDLPKTQSTQSPDLQRHIALVMDPAGQVYLNSQPIGAPALAKALADIARRNPETEVRLRADDKVPYGRVVQVMGLAQKAGLSRVGFVTEPEAYDAP